MYHHSKVGARCGQGKLPRKADVYELAADGFFDREAGMILSFRVFGKRSRLHGRKVQVRHVRPKAGA